MSIGWAIVGTGRVSRQVAKAIQAAEGAELKAVVSRDRGNAEVVLSAGAFRGRRDVYGGGSSS